MAALKVFPKSTSWPQQQGDETASYPSPQRGRGAGVRVCLLPSPCPLPKGEGECASRELQGNLFLRRKTGRLGLFRHPLTRILGIMLCLLLASASTGWAKGKRKSGRAKPPVHNGSAPTESVVEPAASKASPAPSEARLGEPRTAARESLRQESRIEFDERMLRGQSAAGVIYLFQRSPSDWKSTVEVPDSFRQRTVDVLTTAEDKK